MLGFAPAAASGEDACLVVPSDDLAKRPGLKDQAARRGLLIGTAADRDTLFASPTYRQAIRRECTLLTPENSMKWERLRPAPEVYDFTKADWLVDFAASHGLLVHGHTLVWHSQLPPWVDAWTRRDHAETAMIDHIEKMVGRYAGRLRSWDVVNEAIDPGDGRADGLRLTPWLQHLGPAYIDVAFQVAAAADPKALLVYNELGLAYDDEDGARRRGHLLDLLSRLIAKETPVHAVGIQAHLSADRPPSFEGLDQFLGEIASLGLKVMITELDVSDQTLPDDMALRDCLVAATYSAFLETVLRHSSVVSIGTWGLSDPHSWLNEFAPRADGLPPRPLPLDAAMTRKPAWLAIWDALEPS